MAIGIGEELVFGVLVAAAAGLYLLMIVLMRPGERRRVARAGLLLFGPALVFGFSAAVTPPDLITTFMLALPLGLIGGAAVGVWACLRFARAGRAQSASPRDVHSKP